MVGFSDIHTHILPGVDDGAKDIQKALDMIRMAYENGTRTLFLTPHYRGRYKCSPDKLKGAFLRLHHGVHQSFPDMRLYLGCEVHYQNEVPEWLNIGEILTMADSDYVLLEFGNKTSRTQILHGTSEIIRYGYVPIVAHVERYEICRKERSIINELIDMGALIQVNAESVLGRHGVVISYYCRRLLKDRCVHFIASDAHNCTNRPPCLRRCFLYVHKKFGAEYAADLFYNNQQTVINRNDV